MQVDPLNHDFQPNCFAFVEDVFLQVECIHTRPGCSEAASSCCLDSRRKLFKVWHICDPISLISSPAADKEDPYILKSYPYIQGLGYLDIISFRGSAAEYDPDYLLDQEIVLVTLQYRFSH